MGLMRLGLFVLAAVLLYMVLRKLFIPRRYTERAEESDERLGRLVQDPNCEVYVDSKEAVRRKVPDGELFFCSKRCADEYLERTREGS